MYAAWDGCAAAAAAAAREAGGWTYRIHTYACVLAPSLAAFILDVR